MKVAVNSIAADSEKVAKKIAVVTAIHDEWGGCEELWSRSLPLLQDRGHTAMVFKPVVHRKYPRISSHIDQGVKFYELCPKRPLLLQLWRTAMRKWKYHRKANFPDFAKTEEVHAFGHYLSDIEPDLVVISQGINFDGLGYAYACMVRKIPYVIVSHKAVDFYWPAPEDRKVFRDLLRNARACYFVSRHNKRLTEEQFGLRLPHGHVVFNPVKLSHYVQYPPVTDGFRLCCVGRLFIGDKGQDILLRILSKKTWKERPIQVTFIGDGKDKEALMDLACLLEVTNVSFAGYADDMPQVWRHHHALILPSRCEGLPLTIIEAMFAARPVVTTCAGGNAELLEDGVTGFIGNINEESFEEAMERAWDRRMDWEQMGIRASGEIARIVPESPERNFVEMLITHL